MNGNQSICEYKVSLITKCHNPACMGIWPGLLAGVGMLTPPCVG